MKCTNSIIIFCCISFNCGRKINVICKCKSKQKQADIYCFWNIINQLFGVYEAYFELKFRGKLQNKTSGQRYVQLFGIQWKNYQVNSVIVRPN